LANLTESRLILEFSGLSISQRLLLLPPELSGADPAAGYSLFAVNYGSHKLEPADVLRGFPDDNDRQGLSSMQVVSKRPVEALFVH
jgi:hypothetical protein